MGLETGSFISDLVATNPLGTDDRSQGDDHIRLIKSVLKTTFPNVAGAVTASHAQLNAAAAPGALCFPGMIAMWSGNVGSIPSGWKLCNGTGTISTGGAVPDLRNRFIVGTTTNSGGTYNVGDTGGLATGTASGTTGTTNLSVTVPVTGWGTTGVSPGPSTTIASGRMVVGSGSVEITETIESIKAAGASQVVSIPGHTHTFSSTFDNRPPYFALAFIIKD